MGDQDGIASWHVMKARLDALSALGIDTEFHVYEGLGHGFGLGTGTSAEGGWMTPSHFGAGKWDYNSCPACRLRREAWAAELFGK